MTRQLRLRFPGRALEPLAVLRSLNGTIATPREIRGALERAGWDWVKIAVWEGNPPASGREPPVPGRANVTVRKAGAGRLQENEPVKVIAVWGE